MSESARERGLRFAARWSLLAAELESSAVVALRASTSWRLSTSATLYRTRARWLRHEVARMDRDMQAVAQVVTKAMDNVAEIMRDVRRAEAKRPPPSFLTSVPGPPVGHRMIGVMPREAVLDRPMSGPREALMREAAERFTGKPAMVEVQIGGPKVPDGPDCPVCDGYGYVDWVEDGEGQSAECYLCEGTGEAP